MAWWLVSSTAYRRLYGVTVLCVVTAASIIRPFPQVAHYMSAALETIIKIVATVLILRISHFLMYRSTQYKRRAVTQGTLPIRGNEAVMGGHVHINQKDTQEAPPVEKSTDQQNVVFSKGNCDDADGQMAAKAQPSATIETVAVLGSGGHTEEMLQLLRGLDLTKYRIHFVIADTDKRSVERVSASDFGVQCDKAKHTDTFVLITGEKVILIYIESVCRVENLSLSGYLLYPFVDKLFVQWPQLHKRYPHSEYHGFLY